MRLLARVCFGLGTVVISVGAGAQQGGASPLRPRQTPPPARTISVDVVVAPKSGEPVSGLQAKDFTVLDQGKPEAITNFQAFDGKKEPVEVILLIDAVNAGFQEVSQERGQIDTYLRGNGGALAEPMALAVLTNSGVQMQGTYTRDGNGLATALDKYTIGLRTIGQAAAGAGMSERMQGSLKALRMLTMYESTRPGHKMILWISPGWSLLSGPRVDLTYHQQEGIFNEITWLSTELRKSQTTIYSVNSMGVSESVSDTFFYQGFLNGVAKPADDGYGNLGLQVIATQTGGLVLNSGNISKLLRQCVEDGRAYYRISFEPPPTERRDVYHRLEIKVGEPGLKARTSTGYYGEP
jgi:VWFA-related protein